MEELPEWLRAPRPSRSTKSNMAALSLIHFLPSSASVTSRIEQFEHLTSSSESRQSSSRTMLGREMSSSVARVRPLSVPVPSCSQCIAAAESRQGIHFDDTSSESDSPSKVFYASLCFDDVKIYFRGLSLGPFCIHYMLTTQHQTSWVLNFSSSRSKHPYRIYSSCS